MDYIIRSFDAKRGQITVEYASKWTYVVDLPVENGAFPIGEKLEQVIQNMAPVWLVEREASLVNTPANVEYIQALVQPLPSQETEANISIKETIRQSDAAFITEVVNDILTAKGL